MTPEQHRKASELFLQMRDLSAEKRLALLETEQDSEVRDEATSLLAASDGCGDFLERSVQVNVTAKLAEGKIARGDSSESAVVLDATTEQANPAGGTLQQVGRYRLLQLIGEGGHGTVFMAEQTDPVSRKVAVKLIKPGMDSKQVLARFQAERQALAMMDHPSIARMIDGGRAENGLPYFVMELVKGIPIDEFCETNQLGLRERLRLFLQVCNAVHHAHQKGVIHRDIKPSNILVTMGEAEPLAKVIDFGIAKALDNRLTNETLFTEYGQMIGTLQYMSPEQAEMSAVDIDTRSDVYSLGVLLYQLLTGTPPITRDEIVRQGFFEVPRLIRETEPPTPSSRVTTTQRQQTSRGTIRKQKRGVEDLKQGDLDWIAMKALEKDRRRRFDSVLDLARDVERFLNGDVVLSHPPFLAYRLGKFARKHWLTAAVGGLVAASMLLGLLGLVTGLNKANSALAKAERDRNAAVAARRDLSKNMYSELVQSAWRKVSQHDAERASSMLQKCDEELRGWEWKFVNSKATQVGHRQLRDRGNSLIRCIVQSPSDDRIACVVENRNVEIRDATTGVLSKTLTNCDANTACYSLDGTVLIVGSIHGDLMTYDASNFRQTGKRKLPLGGIYGIARNEQYIAVCTGGGWVVVVDPGTLEPITQWNPSSRLSRVCFADRETIVAAGMNGNAYVLSVGEEVIRREFISQATLIDAATDGERIAILSAGKVISFEAEIPKDLNAAVWNCGSTTSALSFSANGDVAVGCLDGRLFLQTGVEQPRQVAKFGNAISAVSSTKLSNEFLVALADGRLIRIDTLGSEAVTFDEDRPVTQFLTLRDQDVVLACAADGYLRAFEASTGQLLRERKISSSGVWSMAVDPNGRVVATVGDDQQLRCWGVPTFDLLMEQQIDWGVRDVAVSPDGKWLAAAPPPNGKFGQQEGTVGLWSIENQSCEKLLQGHKNWVLKLRWAADGTRLVSAGENRDVRIWDVASGSQASVILPERSSAEHIVIGDDGQTLLLGHRDGWLTAWDLTTTQPKYAIAAFGDALTSLKLSKDNRILATSRSSSLLRVFQPDVTAPVAELDFSGGPILGFELLGESVLYLDKNRKLQRK